MEFNNGKREDSILNLFDTNKSFRNKVSRAYYRKHPKHELLSENRDSYKSPVDEVASSEEASSSGNRQQPSNPVGVN